MAGDPKPIETRIKRTYTIIEACELQKIYDLAGKGDTFSWVNARTGRPCLIGYTR